MKSKIKSLLLSFHFGSIEDSDRIWVERELLTHPDVLVDFLDLKRSLELTEPIPSGPETRLWI